ncbi:MAG: cold shock domain-containing protein [Phaeodactylibacter sp.]|nr:cold shock domain-containing protein [Phaeodactylibacter sp.]
MMIGVVQFFLKDKGYGYIRLPDTREEYFVHQRNLLQPIERGMKVQFVLKENKQGAFADEVRPVKQPG